MKRLALIAIILLTSCTGCALHDALFGVFGGGYSGGGETWAEKRSHYDNQVDGWADRQRSYDREVESYNY